VSARDNLREVLELSSECESPEEAKRASMATSTSPKWRLLLGKLRVPSGKDFRAVLARHGFVWTALLAIKALAGSATAGSRPPAKNNLCAGFDLVGIYCGGFRTPEWEPRIRPRRNT
jgi:hypothetical protein